MRVVLQRVKHASVHVDGQETGSIGQGFLILLGVSDTDDESIAELEGYMDFERYGSDCMEHDGVVETEFGRLRRLEPPFPEQAQEQQMLK